LVIRREYYYSYNGVAVTGVPDKKTSRRLVGGKNKRRVNNNNETSSENNNWGVGATTTAADEQLTTADGYNSAGVPSSGNKPKMASKWPKGVGRSIELERMQDDDDDVVRQNVLDDIGQHCKALRDDSASLVDYSER
jgi:hypothetical protein